MTTTPVEVVGRSVADASGVCTIALQTVPPWKRWTITRLMVQSTSTARTNATVYRNSVSPSNALDSAAVSGNNDTTDTVFEIRAGEQLVVQWTGATVGAACTVTLSGRQDEQA